MVFKNIGEAEIDIDGEERTQKYGGKGRVMDLEKIGSMRVNITRACHMKFSKK